MCQATTHPSLASSATICGAGACRGCAQATVWTCVCGTLQPWDFAGDWQWDCSHAERGREAEALDEIAARRLLSPVGLVNGNAGSDVNAPIDFWRTHHTSVTLCARKKIRAVWFYFGVCGFYSTSIFLWGWIFYSSQFWTQTETECAAIFDIRNISFLLFFCKGIWIFIIGDSRRKLYMDDFYLKFSNLHANTNIFVITINFSPNL